MLSLSILFDPGLAFPFLSETKLQTPGSEGLSSGLSLGPAFPAEPGPQYPWSLLLLSRDLGPLTTPQPRASLSGSLRESCFSCGRTRRFYFPPPICFSALLRILQFPPESTSLRSRSYMWSPTASSRPLRRSLHLSSSRPQTHSFPPKFITSGPLAHFFPDGSLALPEPPRLPSDRGHSSPPGQLFSSRNERSRRSPRTPPDHSKCCWRGEARMLLPTRQ